MQFMNENWMNLMCSPECLEFPSVLEHLLSRVATDVHLVESIWLVREANLHHDTGIQLPSLEKYISMNKSAKTTGSTITIWLISCSEFEFRFDNGQIENKNVQLSIIYFYPIGYNRIK